MRNLYYSNYIEKLTDGKKAALYHKLNGSFIVFPNLNAIKIIDNIVFNNEYPSKASLEILEKLLDEGFLLKNYMTEEEERDTYRDYYIIANKTIFGIWTNEALELSVPSAKGIRRIKLNKSFGQLWVKLNKHCLQLKDAENDFFVFTGLSNYKSPLFKLVRKENLNLKSIFSNLYLEEFHEIELPKTKSNPKALYLKLTDACNMNCKMCGQANNKKLGLLKNYNFLDFNIVKEFIEPVIKDLEFVNLWGGEPLLHPKIIDFIEYFIKNKKYVSIATNGTFLRKYAELLVSMGVDEIVVSLDGPKEIHNMIRGNSSAFDDLRLGISEIVKLKECMQIKPKLFLNCTVTEENIDYLQELLVYAKEWKVNKLIYQLPMFITEKQGNEYSNLCEKLWGITPVSWRGFVSDYNLDLDKLYSFYNYTTNNYGDFVSFYNISFNNKEKLKEYFNNPDDCLGKSKCLILDSTIVIEANGDLVTCPDFPDISYKNIKETDFQKYWNSTIRKEFIEGFNNKCYQICSRCCQFV